MSGKKTELTRCRNKTHFVDRVLVPVLWRLVLLMTLQLLPGWGSFALADEEFKVEPVLPSPQTSLQNVANNPLSEIPMLQLQNYLQPMMTQNSGAGNNQPILRGMLPFEALGLRHIMRASIPVPAVAWQTDGTQVGLGDTTIYDVPVFRKGNVDFGIGPLLVLPTATNSTLGLQKWQAGAEVLVSAVYPWGLLASLVSYQQAADGTGQLGMVQPFFFRNIAHGFYYRSTGISTYNFNTQAYAIPIGVGLGHVSKIGQGNILNVYIEPQYSASTRGANQPTFQLELGFNIQFP